MSKKLLLIFTNIFIVILSIFSSRWIFSQKFDPIYFKHFYDHSQWSIPNSPRVMGDGELYQYAGYRLLQGDHPFQINPEAPPAGKYLIGLSIKLFNNAYIINIPLYLLSGILVYLITKILFKSKQKALLSSLLYFSSPLVFSQLGDTALDLTHLTFLLVFIWSFLNFNAVNPPSSMHQCINTLLLGLSLGLFIGTKVGLFALALIIPSFYLLAKQKDYKKIFQISTIALATYIVIYFQYFASGHSFLDWLKSQKWIFNFYISSKVSKNPFVYLGTSLLGIFKWSTSWERVGEWTLLWTIGLASLVHLIKHKKNNEIQIISNIFIGLSFSFLLIPFAVRYIILVLPFFIWGFLIISKKLPKYTAVLIVLIHLLQAGGYILSSPFREIDRINQLLENNRFEDVYNNILLSDGTTREDFAYPIHNFIYNLKADDVSFGIEKHNFKLFSVSTPITFNSSYQTAIGNIIFSKEGFLVKTNNRWKLVWDWQFIAPNFSPKSEIVFTQNDNVSADLVTSDQKILSGLYDLPFISIIPENVQNEDDLLELIDQITNIDSVTSRNMIHVNYPPHLPKRISFAKTGYKQNLIDKISTNSAVLLTFEKHPKHRTYSDGVIEGKYLYNIKQLEKTQKNLNLYFQGSITFINDGQSQLIFQKDDQEINNVHLDQTLTDLLGAGAEIYF